MRRLVPIVVLFFVGAPAALAWTWPVRGPVVQAFDFDQAHPYAAGQHCGIAIGADPGTTVVAPAPGTVSFVGSVPTSGKSLTIETSAGLSVTLTHLGSASVTKGEWVDEGGAVGTVGPSGTPEVNVPYVHLGLRELARDQGYLDPLRFLPLPVESPAPVVPPPPPAVPGRTAGAGRPPAAPPRAGSRGVRGRPHADARSPAAGRGRNCPRSDSGARRSAGGCHRAGRGSDARTRARARSLSVGAWNRAPRGSRS